MMLIFHYRRGVQQNLLYGIEKRSTEIHRESKLSQFDSYQFMNLFTKNYIGKEKIWTKL